MKPEVGGFSLEGKGKPTQPFMCDLINTLTCAWKQRLSQDKLWKGTAKHLSHTALFSACLMCRAKEFIHWHSSSQSQGIQYEKFNAVGLSPNQKIPISHHTFWVFTLKWSRLRSTAILNHLQFSWLLDTVKLLFLQFWRAQYHQQALAIHWEVCWTVLVWLQLPVAAQ